MNLDEIKLTSFGMWFCVIAAILLYAAVFKLLGDSMALIFADDGNFAGLSDLGPFFMTMLLSWLGTFALLVLILPRLFNERANKVSIVIGVICASICIALIVRFVGFDILLGGPNFDLTTDYLDIIRNLLMGGLIIGALRWMEGQHSAQHCVCNHAGSSHLK